MDGQWIGILALALGLAIGAALGWLAGRQPVTDWRSRFAARDAEARDLEARYLRTFADLEGARERAGRADSLAAELAETRHAREDIAAELAAHRAELAVARARAAEADRLSVELPTVRDEREQLRAELATLKANADNFAEQKRLLLEAQETLRKEFEAAGARVLAGTQEAFLRRAQERFEESEKSSSERLRTLLAPVGERLSKYEQQVSELEARRVDAFGQLTGLIESMRAGQELVRQEAARLGNSLRNAPKARGRWGEQQLRNVLEQCGLAEHTDFVTEHSVTTEDGRLRPDAVVRIPGNKLLVIDAKVSLNAYQDAFEADNDESRQHFLGQHTTSMRNHIQTLGAKSYQSQFEDAPDYVLMFVPGEHFIAAALEHDPQIWNYAFERRVLLASPTNLVAIARTIAQVWRQDGLAREARDIGRMGGELYDRLAIAAEHLKRMGGGLDSAVNHYNKFVGSFERKVLSAGRRLRDKHIEIGKREIEDVPLIESAPRYPTADQDAADAMAQATPVAAG